MKTIANKLVKLIPSVHKELKILCAERGGSFSKNIKFLLDFYKENKK